MLGLFVPVGVAFLCLPSPIINASTAPPTRAQCSLFACSASSWSPYGLNAITS